VIPRMVPGLGLIALALSGTIALELVDRPVPPVVFAVPVAVPHGGPHEADWPTQKDIERGLSMILARPVFSPDRKPIAVGAKGVAGLPRLTGIVVSGSGKIAIFAAPSGGRPVIAEEGAHIDSYEVRAIRDTGVTITGPNGTKMLTPIFDTAQPPSSKPVGSVPLKPAGRETNNKGR
jgi:hypothetical protein